MTSVSTGNSGSDDTVTDSVKLFMRCLQQSFSGRLTVDGVNHDLLGTNGFDGLKPGNDISVTGIVDALALAFASHEHRLNNHGDPSEGTGIHYTD